MAWFGSAHMRFKAIGVTAAMVFTIGMVPGVASADEGDLDATDAAKIEQVADGVHKAEKAAGTETKGARDAADSKAAAQVLQSEYALLKSDGWLYRADKEGKALADGRDWSGENPLAGVKTLFVDAKVPAIGYVAESGIDFSHPAFNVVGANVTTKAKAALAAADETAAPLSCLNTVVFKTNDKGVSSCVAIGEGAFEGAGGVLDFRHGAGGGIAAQLLAGDVLGEGVADFFQAHQLAVDFEKLEQFVVAVGHEALPGDGFGESSPFLGHYMEMAARA